MKKRKRKEILLFSTIVIHRKEKRAHVMATQIAITSAIVKLSVHTLLWGAPPIHRTCTWRTASHPRASPRAPLRPIVHLSVVVYGAVLTPKVVKNDNLGQYPALTLTQP